MDKIRIIGGVPLDGVIAISGAKNAALPLMAASLLTAQTLSLDNVPDLADIATMANLLVQHGATIAMDGDGGAGNGDGASTGGELQWARVRFSHGVRTVPAGSMRFVDFSKPDPAEERAERFMIAAQRAMADGEYELAAKRLVYARDAEPRNVAVLRQMTLAFWQAGNLDAAARSVRDWARVDGGRPAPHRFAARIYEDMGAIDLAEEAAERAVKRGPSDAGSWERLGRLRLQLMDREGALRALERAMALAPTDELRDLIATALAIEPTVAPAA